ncbi:MAG TPA: hypothetical protein VMR90_12255 [Candidatus Cybelea sp.]|nr:hypothetical protein [Candidatus Cybelea sp.]
MSDWKFAQKDVSEELALLHHFSFKKHQGAGERIRCASAGSICALLRRGRHVNQKIAPILPVGWGNSILDALTACARMIREFPYEGEEPVAAKGAPGC